MAFIGFSQEFNAKWDKWKIYKKEQHGFIYKSQITEEAAVRKLHRMADMDEEKMIEIIDECMAEGWKGFWYTGNTIPASAKEDKKANWKAG